VPNAIPGNFFHPALKEHWDCHSDENRDMVRPKLHAEGASINVLLDGVASRHCESGARVLKKALLSALGSDSTMAANIDRVFPRPMSSPIMPPEVSSPSLLLTPVIVCL
jgi:hypothetical protein